MNIVSVSAQSEFPTRERIGQLIARYPAIDADQVASVIDYLRRGPNVDNALLASDPDIAPMLARFRHDHDRKLGGGPVAWATVAMIVIALAIGLALAWDSGLAG